MTKTTARILALVCTVGTLFLVFQIRFLKPGEGPHRVIFSVPGRTQVEEKIAGDLQQAMEEKYGRIHDSEQVGTAMHLGQEMPVVETRTFSVDFLGQSFGADRYLFCSLKTVRTVGTDQQEPIVASQTVTCIAIKPKDSDQVRILWDSLQESYKENQESFDSLAS